MYKHKWGCQEAQVRCSGGIPEVVRYIQVRWSGDTSEMLRRHKWRYRDGLFRGYAHYFVDIFGYLENSLYLYNQITVLL